ncbi:MAG: ABC transporter ATP-binding protein [Erysipelotrichaceae bacterium]|nr:ABC transporter ATP-binding protein [Erysipelotrichaceae bacterium]
MYRVIIMALLETRHLSKVYGLHTDTEFVALHDINFEVEEGEMICIMGPSGSGKSTFINAISTIDYPTSGNVLIDGEEVRALTGKQIGRFRSSTLGFIFQNYNLLDTHTLYENIAMPMSLAKVNQKEQAKRIKELADYLGITACLNKYPNACSGGQKQRAAICRALVNEPKIIVADEPTGNLDSKNSKRLMDVFKDLNDQGVTIIMVTHDALVASYSSRFVYLHDGRIETELRRGDLSQDEYFEKIMAINARESQEVLKQ